jgi:hypothetical protein
MSATINNLKPTHDFSYRSELMLNLAMAANENSFKNIINYTVI